MATIWVRKIDGGLDVRRLPETTDGGALIKADDGHLNRGGEFEKRAAFVAEYTLPAGTMSLAANASSLYVFGSAASPVGLPSGVLYQRLQNGAKTLDRVKSWDLFSNKFYAVALYTDTTISGFYDGAIDADFPANGSFVQTIGTKEYATSGSILYSSKVAVPDEWTTGTGVGFADMSQYLSGAESLVALADYQNGTAVFAERTIVIWSLSSDWADSVRTQTLRNTGTASPRSVCGFGDGDVFYLDESGLRSLRARDASNAASTSGLGVRVDPLIVEKLRSLTADERSKVISLVEPQDGRFWLIMKDVIFVFSYFPEEKISGWTKYNCTYFNGGVETTFNVDDAVVFNRRVYLRSGNTIFCYGGISTGLTTDATEAEAWTAYLDGSNPAQKKHWTGFDAAVSGEWSVSAAMNINDTSTEDDVANINRTTFNNEAIGGIGESTHISLRFRSRGSEDAVLSACAVHYDPVDSEE